MRISAGSMHLSRRKRSVLLPFSGPQRPLEAYLKPEEMLEVLPGLENPRYEPIRVITFHTRTTAKFYGDDYAVEES